MFIKTMQATQFLAKKQLDREQNKKTQNLILKI